MKQKLLWAVVLCCVGLLMKLAYDVYFAQNQQIQTLLQQQQDNQQQLADLNDRLVAVARQQPLGSNLLDKSTSLTQTLNAAQTLQLEMQHHEVQQMQQQWSYATIQLAQQSLTEGQVNRALQLLQQVQTQLVQQNDAKQDALNVALSTAISNDQVQIKQSAVRNQAARQQVIQALSQLEQQLLLLADREPAFVAAHHDASSTGVWHMLSHILIVEQSNPATQHAMANRGLVCRQGSFGIALARQALMSGNDTLFQQYIQDAQTQLKPLADDDVRQVVLQLSHLAQQLPAPATLTSLALLDNQRAADSQRADSQRVKGS